MKNKTLFLGMLFAGVLLTGVYFAREALGIASKSGVIQDRTFNFHQAFGTGTTTPAATSSAPIVVVGARKVTAVVSRTSTTSNPTTFTFLASDIYPESRLSFFRVGNAIKHDGVRATSTSVVGTGTGAGSATSTLSLDLTNQGYYAIRCNAVVTGTTTVHIHSGNSKATCDIIVEY